MNNLTQEQRQTIEDAFNSLPEYMRTGTYRTMEGIEEQLASGSQTIIYMTRGADTTDDGGLTSQVYEMKSMKVEQV
jgi:hypothetical protein